MTVLAMCVTMISLLVFLWTTGTFADCSCDDGVYQVEYFGMTEQSNNIFCFKYNVKQLIQSNDACQLQLSHFTIGACPAMTTTELQNVIYSVSNGGNYNVAIGFDPTVNALGVKIDGTATNFEICLNGISETTNDQNIYFKAGTTVSYGCNIPNLPNFDANTHKCKIPTMNPSIKPTLNPSYKPTSNPTNKPTMNPSLKPTLNPTYKPTNNPSFKPTSNPTSNPTYKPTSNPSFKPTNNPTLKPTNNPSFKPTSNPTYKPTSNPSFKPTNNPSFKPTSNPTYKPTTNPTSKPTEAPTLKPTMQPTQSPTRKCDTAFAFANNEISKCFLDLGLNLIRWGWTNYYTISDNMQSFSMILYAGAGQCDRSKAAEVGTVTINYDGSNDILSFNIMANTGFDFSAYHIYVGKTSTPLDSNGVATVAPGQYNIVYDLPMATFETQHSFNVNNIDAGNWYIIVHAVSCQNNYQSDIFENYLDFKVDNNNNNNNVYKKSMVEEINKSTLIASSFIIIGLIFSLIKFGICMIDRIKGYHQKRDDNYQRYYF